MADLLATDASSTAIQAARAEQLLERHGVVTRDAVLAEGLPGGFAGIYPVFRALEDAGRVRRGYFVEGMGGSQFALPGAVDRLRIGRDRIEPTLLAAADPANPFGSALPWPDHPGRPSRSAGAFVILAAEGRLLAFVERSGRTVLTFSDEPGDLAAIADRLALLARRRMRRMVIGTVDGNPAAATPLGHALTSGGFVESYRGMILAG